MYRKLKENNPLVTDICAHRGGAGDKAVLWEHWPAGYNGMHHDMPIEEVSAKERRSAWENQLDTFRECSSDTWELDVWLSADGIPVVSHDGNLNRTHGIDRYISELTSEELAALDPPVSPWVDYLDLAEEKQVKTVFTELKAGDIKQQNMYSTYGASYETTPVESRYSCKVTENDLLLARKVAEIARERVQNGGWKAEQLPVIGFIHEQLEAAQAANPEGQNGYSFSRETFGYSEREMDEQGAKLGMERLEQMISIAQERSGGTTSSINPDYRYISPAFVTRAHDAGLKICAWTPNDHESIRDMLRAKVDILITDMPERAQKLQQQIAVFSHSSGFQR